MDVREARRITGRHLWIDGPGAAAEVSFGPHDDVDYQLARVKERVEAACVEVLGEPSELVVRRHAGGATVALRAPPDRLEAAATLIEWAVDKQIRFREVLAVRDREDNASLRTVVAMATEAGLPVFHDDDGLTIGLGARSTTWPL